MSLLDQGMRYYISPDKTQSRWLHPVEQAALYVGWLDVSDWPCDKLVSYLMSESPAA